MPMFPLFRSKSHLIRNPWTKYETMTRLNISFNAHVPTLHPSILMTLLSVLSVLRLFGISVTLAPPNCMMSTHQIQQIFLERADPS